MIFLLVFLNYLIFLFFSFLVNRIDVIYLKIPFKFFERVLNCFLFFTLCLQFLFLHLKCYLAVFFFCNVRKENRLHVFYFVKKNNIIYAISCIQMIISINQWAFIAIIQYFSHKWTWKHIDLAIRHYFITHFTLKCFNGRRQCK